MSLAFDAVGPNSSGATVGFATTPDTLTWSHTCSGSQRLLIVGVSCSFTTDTGADCSATYNGVSMTGAAAAIHSGGGTNGIVRLFYLINPASGAHNVVVTVTGGASTGNILAGSISFTGADQSTGVQNVQTGTGSGTSPSIVVTSATGNMVVDVIGNGSNIPVSTQTGRWSRAVTNSTRAGNAGGSTAAGASSVTMGYTTTSDSWGMMAVDVIAAAATNITGTVATSQSA